MTEPTPASTPSTRAERTKPAGTAADTPSCSQAIPASIQPIGASAQLKTAWNIRNSSAARMTGPRSGLSTTRSSARVSRRPSPSASVTARAMARASAPKARVSAAGGGRMLCGGSAPATVSDRTASRSSRPRRRTATVGTTGTPSRAASAGASSSSPSRAAMSMRFRATTVGRWSRSASSTKRRCWARLVASTTMTSAVGGRSPAWRPIRASRVTCSSGERGVRL